MDDVAVQETVSQKLPGVEVGTKRIECPQREIAVDETSQELLAGKNKTV